MTLAVHLRAFDLADAAACCYVVNSAVMQMAELSAAARAFIVAKNVPDKLGPELARLYAIVAIANDAIVGVGALEGTEIKRVYVLPERQARGVGSALVRALEHEARRVSASTVVLDASPSSVSFYARHGYVAQGEQRSMLGTAEVVHVRMEKPLVS